MNGKVNSLAGLLAPSALEADDLLIIGLCPCNVEGLDVVEERNFSGCHPERARMFRFDTHSGLVLFVWQGASHLSTLFTDHK